MASELEHKLVDAGAAALDALTETEATLEKLRTALRALANETISKGQRLPEEMKLVANAYVGSGQRMLKLLGESVPDADSSPDLKQWWLSWYHSPLDSPFTYNGPWWISGGTLDDPPRTTVVAAVRARTKTGAWQQIATAYDERPKHLEERFCDEFEGSPYSERFPQADWMQW
jgi:hypothetical protein